MRSCLGSAGFANQEVALNARRGTLSLLAQLRCFLGKAFFKEGSLCETATLWHTLLHPFEDWRERDRRSHHR
jgi:hypothetical protein